MADAASDPQAMDEILADLRAKFGAFEPPADWQPPEAMRGDPPRRPTARTRRGCFAQKRRKSLLTGLSIGLLLLASGLTGFAHEMGNYFLPLRYAEWIGLGIVVLAVGYMVAYRWQRGHFRYVEKGRAIPGRVACVSAWTNVVGGAGNFGICTSVEFRHPETGVLCIAHTRGDVLSSVTQMALYSTTLKPGDPVTLVYIPGEFNRTVATWELLGLDAENQPVLKNGKPVRATPVAKAVGTTVGVFALIWLLFAGLFTWMFYTPLDGKGLALTAAAIGAVGALAGSAIGFTPGMRLKQRIVASCAGASVAGILMFLAAGSLLTPINVLFDGSKAEYHPVEVVNYWQTTHSHVIRTYEIEYTDLQTGQSGRKDVRHGTLLAFTDANVGMFAVHRGAFGWNYVSGLHPVRVVASDGAGSREVLVETEGGEWKPIRLDLLIELGDGEYDAVPPELRRMAWQRLEKDGTIRPLPEEPAPADDAVPSSGDSLFTVPG